MSPEEEEEEEEEEGETEILILRFVESGGGGSLTNKAISSSATGTCTKKGKSLHFTHVGANMRNDLSNFS